MLIPVTRDQDQQYWTKRDLQLLLSHNPDVAGAMSPRAYGKSYQALELIREKALDKGEWCCWGRYNREEMKQAKADILSKLPVELDKRLSSQASPVYTDPTTDGHIMLYSWNIQQNLKGVDHPFVYNICDEFIPERYTNRTRYDTEFQDWNSCRKSLARSYDCMKTVLLSNCIDWFNPFFVAWDIPPFPKGNIYKDRKVMHATVNDKMFKTERTIVFENVAGTNQIIERTISEQALEFGSDKELQAYFDNEFQQQYTQIGKCPDLRRSPVEFQIMTLGYYMSYREYDGMYYWYHVTKPRQVDTYVSEAEYMDAMKHRYRITRVQNTMVDAFNDGRFVFDSPESLAAFYRWVRNMRIKIRW